MIAARPYERCGASHGGRRPGARYCSPACRRGAARQREARREPLAADPVENPGEDTARRAHACGAALRRLEARLDELAQDGFEGIAMDLLGRLEEIVGEAAARRKEWPGSPRVLSRELRRIATNLRALGVGVEFARESGKGRRIIPVRNVRAQASQGVGPDGSDGSDARSRPSPWAHAEES